VFEKPSSHSRGLRAASAAALGFALVVLGGMALAQQGKYALKVPGGLAFSEFRGYEGWQVVSTGQNDRLLAVILANPMMIEAYQAGIPANGRPVPDGAKIAKIHWKPKQHQYFPNSRVPDTLHDVDFMVKDSTRFADSGGWGYAVFRYDTASGAFTPGTLADQPPQANDAKCGYACHTLVKTKDYVFTEYGQR